MIDKKQISDWLCDSKLSLDEVVDKIGEAEKLDQKRLEKFWISFCIASTLLGFCFGTYFSF